MILSQRNQIRAVEPGTLVSEHPSSLREKDFLSPHKLG
jgi:hypothetical protein